MILTPLFSSTSVQCWTVQDILNSEVAWLSLWDYTTFRSCWHVVLYRTINTCQVRSMYAKFCCNWNTTGDHRIGHSSLDIYTLAYSYLCLHSIIVTSTANHLGFHITCKHTCSRLLLFRQLLSTNYFVR